MIKLGNWFAKHNDDRAFEEYMKAVGDITSVLRAADARPTPPPALSATDRLQRNLERTVSESTARAEVLRQEIAAREAELADVLRAEEAASVALVALADAAEEDAPSDEPVMAWPFAPINLDQEHVFDESGRPIGATGRITEDDLSAACGLALEAEMQEKPALWLMPDDIAAEGDRANGK